MYDYIIIGAGITGITLCKKLREKGKRVICLEKESEPGGLCRSKTINGHVLDIGGGHFFGTKIPEIKDFVFSHIPKEHFNYFERISKIHIYDTDIDYPIESNLWQLPMNQRIDFLISTIRNGESMGKPEPLNYEEWIRWKLGDKICDEYMIPYNQKLWGVNPKELDIDWLNKIPKVNINEILLYCFEQKQDKTKFPAHMHFYYPKVGGFQSIVDALVRDELPFIRLCEKVDSLKRDNNVWIVNNKYESDSIVNTTPWNDLYEALGSPQQLEPFFKKIKYNRLNISLYEASCDINWHWRYVPDKNYPYHREFNIHSFAKDSKPGGIYLETNLDLYDGSNNLYNGKPMLAQFKTDAAYPIPVVGHGAAISRILSFYKDQKLYGIGRWGQHEYQNADISMNEAIKFAKEQ